MQRYGAVRWFGPLPLASALAAAVVVGLSALVETTRLALPAAPLRAVPQPALPQAPSLSSGPAPRAVTTTRCLGFAPRSVSRAAAPGRYRAPVRSASRSASRLAVQG
jgi:hypothetical protein